MRAADVMTDMRLAALWYRQARSDPQECEWNEDHRCDVYWNFFLLLSVLTIVDYFVAISLGIIGNMFMDTVPRRAQCASPLHHCHRSKALHMCTISTRSLTAVNRSMDCKMLHVAIL